jgi:hypothetical protein
VKIVSLDEWSVGIRMRLGGDVWKWCHLTTFIFVVKGNDIPKYKRSFECLSEIVVCK